MIGALEKRKELFEFMDTSGMTSKICHCHSNWLKAVDVTLSSLQAHKWSSSDSVCRSIQEMKKICYCSV